MKVSELVEYFKKAPQDMPVFIKANGSVAMIDEVCLRVYPEEKCIIEGYEP